MNSLAFDNIKSATVYIFPQENPDRIEIEFSIPTPYSLIAPELPPPTTKAGENKRALPQTAKWVFNAPHGQGKDYVKVILQMVPTIKDLSTSTAFDEEPYTN